MSDKLLITENCWAWFDRRVESHNICQTDQNDFTSRQCHTAIQTDSQHSIWLSISNLNLNKAKHTDGKVVATSKPALTIMSIQSRQKFVVKS